MSNVEMTATPVENPVDKSDGRVRRMFGQIAPNYDRMNHLLSANVDKYWRWYTVRKVPPTGDAPILDVCTGTGDLAFAYAKAAKGQVDVMASDFTPEMLELGEKKKPKFKHGDKVTFREADAQDLPFDDDTYQIVTVSFGLRNVSDTDKGLREMTRVCKPGGKVAVLEFSTPQWQPMKGVYGWYFRNVLPRIGQMFAKNDEEAYAYLPESVGQFPQGKELTQKMEAAGLSDVVYYSLTFGVATLYVGTK